MWVALGIVRTRALPRGTVVKPSAMAKTPSSNKRAENSLASGASPSITGVMGVSPRPKSNPRRRISALKVGVFCHSRSSSSGDSSSTSTAAMQAAASAGVMALEKRKGRAFCRKESVIAGLPATQPLTKPKALESVPTSTSTRRDFGQGDVFGRPAVGVDAKYLKVLADVALPLSVS